MNFDNLYKLSDSSINSTLAYEDYIKFQEELYNCENIANEYKAVSNFACEIARRAKIKVIKAKEKYKEAKKQEERDKKALIDIEKIKIILQTRLELDSQGLLYYLYIDEINKNYELSRKRYIQESDLEEHLEGYQYLRFIRVYITFEEEFNPLGQALYKFFKCSHFDNLYDIIERIKYKDRERMKYLLFLLSLDTNQFKRKIDKDVYMDELTKIENYLEYFNRIFELTRWIKHNFNWLCMNHDLFDMNSLLEPSLAIHVI